MVKVVVGPVHPSANGVTVMVATCGTLVALLVMKLNRAGPAPLAAKPIDGLLFVQVYVVAGTVLLNTTVAVAAPLHTTWLGMGFTCGVGFTVIVNTIGLPVQVTPPLV